MQDQPSDNRWNDIAKAIPFLNQFLNPKDRIAVLRMGGVIADPSMMRRAGISYHKFREAVAEAFEIKKLKALALLINSPGGAPAQCSLISSQIQALSAEKNIPVFAFVEDVAASGGYWLACIGDEIYAQESSIVGSIGVISSGFGLDQFIRKHDIERRVHTSGREKSFLDPFKPEKADDLARLRKVQSGIHEAFKLWVRSRRGGKLSGSDEDLMEGAFWTGLEAVERGLIDGIGDVASVMKEKYGEEIDFIDCTPGRKGVLASLLSSFGGEARAAIGFDPGALLEVAEERSAWNRFGL